jgi:hypothetical protein
MDLYPRGPEADTPGSYPANPCSGDPARWPRPAAGTQGSGQEEGRGYSVNEAAPPTDPPTPRGPNRRQRRLSDHVLIAFHFACDQGDLETADQLIAILERIVLRPAGAGHRVRRTEVEPLVAAHERLWTLRHPEAGDQ